MALEMTLDYDHDPIEDMVKNADEAKLRELLRIFVQFEKYEMVLFVQQELRRRGLDPQS